MDDKTAKASYALGHKRFKEKARNRVKIGGGFWGWTPTGKQITPTANTREKARGSGFDPPWA